MPSNSHNLPTYSRQEFCLALKSSRERKGIRLAEIAATTKIPASLFAALERNDLRCWPKGLFRRSFFRDYARAIGVPVAEACAEFVRLFPDDEGAALIKAVGMAEVDEQAANDVRLVLDAAWHGPRPSILSRLVAASIDAGAVILIAIGLAWVVGMDPFAVTAIVALAYFSVATVFVGESPAKWALARRQSIVDALSLGPRVRGWVTDARRVGPPPSSQLRVRFKVTQ